MRADSILKRDILHNGLFVAMMWQQNQTDDRQFEIQVDGYMGDTGLRCRGFDDLVEPVQFAVLPGTCYGATCSGDLSTWQKSASSSTSSPFGQLGSLLLKSGTRVL
jgi:hypothetical protein